MTNRFGCINFSLSNLDRATRIQRDEDFPMLLLSKCCLLTCCLLAAYLLPMSLSTGDYSPGNDVVNQRSPGDELKHRVKVKKPEKKRKGDYNLWSPF